MAELSGVSPPRTVWADAGIERMRIKAKAIEKAQMLLLLLKRRKRTDPMRICGNLFFIMIMTV
jgi:hypothetical protein